MGAHERRLYLLAEKLRSPWRSVVLALLLILMYFELPLWCLADGLRD